MNNNLSVMDGQGQPLNATGAGEIVESGRTLEQIKTPFHTAVRVQNPRPSLGKILAKVEEEALISGEEFYYGWGAGKNKIEGPSVKLTNAVSRLYGNCVVMPQPIQETKDAYIFTTAFIDLETGYTQMRQFRQSKKWTIYGNFDPERKDDIRFQIGQSKASRNVVVNSVPPILIKKAMDAAKKGVRQRIENFVAQNGKQAAIDVLLKEFLKVGVKQENLENKYSKKMSAWDVDLIVLAKGDLQALQDGAESAETLFPDLQSKEEKQPDKVDVTMKKSKKQLEQEKRAAEKSEEKPKAKPGRKPKEKKEEPKDDLQPIMDEFMQVFEEAFADSTPEEIEAKFKRVTKETLGKELARLTDLTSADEAKKVLKAFKNDGKEQGSLDV